MKMSIKSLEDNLAFFEVSEKVHKSEVVMERTERAALGQLFDGTRVELVDFEGKSAARDTVVRSVVDDSCKALGPSPRIQLKVSVRALLSQ